MLGDLRILAVAARWTPAGRGRRQSRELLLDAERVALQGLFDMIRRFKVGYELELHKRTLECGLLSLIGPNAAAVAGVDGPQDALARRRARAPRRRDRRRRRAGGAHGRRRRSDL